MTNEASIITFINSSLLSNLNNGILFVGGLHTLCIYRKYSSALENKTRGRILVIGLMNVLSIIGYYAIPFLSNSLMTAVSAIPYLLESVGLPFISHMLEASWFYAIPKIWRLLPLFFAVSSIYLFGQFLPNQMIRQKIFAVYIASGILVLVVFMIWRIVLLYMILHHQAGFISYS